MGLWDVVEDVGDLVTDVGKDVGETVVDAVNVLGDTPLTVWGTRRSGSWLSWTK